MNLTKSALRQSILLGALSDEMRQKLLVGGKRFHAPKGATIFSLGSAGDTALLIETGRVTISLSSSDGRNSILDHLGPGEVVGEQAVLDGGLRSADALAATDVTGTLLGRPALHGLLKQHPDAALAVITALSRRLRNTNESFALQTMADGAVRLSRVLLRLFDQWAKDSPKGPTLALSFSQSELGDMAGLSRESVNRKLRQMQDKGLFERSESGLTLLDRDALEEMARIGEFGANAGAPSGKSA